MHGLTTGTSCIKNGTNAGADIRLMKADGHTIMGDENDIFLARRFQNGNKLVILVQ